MPSSQPSVYIVILNWNNASDTTECLASIQQLNYSNYVTVLIDNGSTDNSLKEIEFWTQGKLPVSSPYLTDSDKDKPITILDFSSEDVSAKRCVLTEEQKQTEASKKLILIRSSENLGFAKGCNIGFRFAMLNGADYVLILNNDTASDTESLNHMVSFLETHPGYDVATAQVRYYDVPGKVSNCGGELRWYGARKYFFSDALIREVPQQGFKKISFINGCVVLFRASLFESSGMFSEKFFFGEEDFEFSWRLKKEKKSAACCYEAIVYHKISSSINSTFGKNNLGKIFIYYLNRYINMRDYMSRPFWNAWRIGYLLYVLPMLKRKYHFEWKKLFLFSYQLLKFSAKLDGVDKKTFEKGVKMEFTSFHSALDENG